MKNKNGLRLIIGTITVYAGMFCSNLLAVSNGTADTLTDIEETHGDTLNVLEKQNDILRDIEKILIEDGVNLSNILFNQKVISNIEKEN